MIRLHLTEQAYDIEEMGFEVAAAIHKRGEGVFQVSARPLRNAATATFRRMSIAVDRVVAVEEVP